MATILRSISGGEMTKHRTILSYTILRDWCLRPEPTATFLGAVQRTYSDISGPEGPTSSEVRRSRAILIFHLQPCVEIVLTPYRSSPIP